MQIEYNPDLILTQEHTVEEVQNYTGSFCGFVLLDDIEYDLMALAGNLNQQGIAVLAPVEESAIIQDLMLDVPGAMVTISLMQEPIPDGEVQAAAMHAQWQGAKDVAEHHKAHLMVAVLPDMLSAIDAGRLYCQILSAALADNQALAVYTSGTVLEPQRFRKHTIESADGLPLENLLFVGTYIGEDGNCGYTVGLDSFGKDELEVLNSEESTEQIAYVLRTCVKQLLTEDAPSRWYFTVDIDGVIWEGRRKDAVMVEGHSIQLQKQ